MFLFHAELDCGALSHTHDANPSDYSTFLDSRPQSLETSAIDLIVRCAEKYPDLRTHIVHLSAANALPQLRAARASGLPLTVETCFHYLVLSAEQIAKGSTLYKCCPPIREEINREALWEALINGDIDFVVSDHSPCTVELKRLEDGDFMQAWGGIGGLGLGLSLLWTEANKRNIEMERVLEWVSQRPAKQVRLHESKGALKVGWDADIAIFDPKLNFTVRELALAHFTPRLTPLQVDKSELHFKNRSSPYEGLELTGAVTHTYLRGERVFSRATGFKDLEPRGQLLL